jgi:molybdenum cofactor biosynthesis enzyme MoaA
MSADPVDKSKLENVICPAVWDHLCVNTMGKNRLCCNAVTQPGDKFIGGFDKHWNEFRDGVKSEMLLGNRPEVCNSCWKKEDAGITSLRQDFVSRYKNSKRWSNFVDRLDVTLPDPTTLDLKLGNYCNLSCRMCSGYSSSGVAGEHKKILADTGVDIGVNEYEKEFVQDKWYIKDEFVDRIKEMINNGLRHLKFTGGEPMMVPSVLKLIDYCIDSGHAKDIDLILITNVTLIDDKWIKKFSHFRFVNIICSIDGVGNTFEYIRHPAVWTDVHSKLKNLSKQSGDTFSISITFTLQLYNLLEVGNMIELSNELECGISVIVLDTPAYLDVRNAPRQLKLASLDQIDKLVDLPSTHKSFVNNIKNAINRPTNNDTTKQFVKLSRLKDTYKNQDIESLEIWNYYK